MRDAIGGVVNIQIILVFIVIVSGYLAFSVNYTKAFRVKNKIITTLEQYNTIDNDAAKAKINDYMDKVGYGGIASGFYPDAEKNCKSSNGKLVGGGCSNGYCICEHISNEGTQLINKKHYYTVTTFINIDIPIINNILPVLSRTFWVAGDTKLLNQ